MAKEKRKKLDIAYEYLDLAMQLYMEKKDYFCAIHLAAAAEEIFGGNLSEKDSISHIATKAEIAMQTVETGETLPWKDARDKILWSKNRIKHIDGPEDADIFIDPKFEAKRWIDDALINLYKLNLSKSQTLWKYEDFCNNNPEK